MASALPETAMDLKIEIRKLNALHEATLRVDHGIRELSDGEWREFAPSRFVYAYFTFNSVYGFDWTRCFDEGKALSWSAQHGGRIPKEPEQFKAYLRFADEKLTPRTGQLFHRALNRALEGFNVRDPSKKLEEVDLTNADKKLKALAKQLPSQFRILAEGRAAPDDFFATACVVLQFVHRVRCNLFHGSKARVQLMNEDQQQRLLIYAAVLIAANSLLFEVAGSSDIGWERIEMDFAPVGSDD